MSEFHDGHGKSAKVISIFVTYRPDIFLFHEALYSLSNQVHTSIIVDNSTQSNLEYDSENILVLALNENVGIAAAQNIGIQKAIELGADYIILSDQDTVYPSNYVAAMLPVFDDYAKACVVVPKFVDSMKKRC